MDNKKRFYNFNLVIYEDDEKFEEQMRNLKEEKDAIWIKHDQDLNEDGELKKPHYHFVLKLKHACTISALSKRINVTENMIEPVKKSLNGCLKYLVHFNLDDKFHYEISDVESNSVELKQRFENLVNGEIPEVNKVGFIQEYIESFNDYVDLAILGKYVQKINMWDAFRRNMMYFIKIVDNHNAKISAAKYHIENDYYSSLKSSERGDY